MKYFAYNYYKYNNNVSLYNNALTNEPITGFYNIDDNGKAFKGKYDKNTPLICDSVIEDELNKSVFYKDRIITDKLVYPYNINDIYINVNDQVKASVINNSLSKIYNNMLYLYANCFIPNNDIPIKMPQWAGIFKDFNTGKVGDKIEWNMTSVYAPMDYNPSNTSLNGIDISLFNSMRDAVSFRHGNYYYIFAITSTTGVALADAPFADTLICLKCKINKQGNLDDISLILNTQFIDDKSDQDIDNISSQGDRVDGLQYSNNILFSRLASITSDQSRYIYLLDNGSNHIYKYDISNIIYEDKLFKNRLLLCGVYGDQDAIGNNNYKFIHPTILRCLNNKLVVIDVGDDSVKIFDSTFNWIKTVSNKNFITYNPVDVMYDEISDNYYILTKNAYILKYDDGFNLITSIFTDIFLNNDKTGDEVCLRIYKSYNDSNICYVMTNHRIYKKYITRLDKNIGSFLFYKNKVMKDIRDIWNSNTSNWYTYKHPWARYTSDFPDDYYYINVKCIAITPFEDRFDNMFVVINGRILYCQDETSYRTLLSNHNDTILNYFADFDIYNSQDILFRDEYVQSLTYNKAIYKLAYNINLLAGKIIFKPIINYDDYTNILIKELKYIVNDIIDINNIKLYDNENVDVVVINRIFEKIQKILDQILENIQSNLLNVKNALINNFDLK